MNKKSRWFGIAVLMALAVFMLSACPSDSGDDPETPGTVTSVTVTPATMSRHPGDTGQFTTTVVVTGGAAETVTWKVEGKDSTVKHADTAISTDGLLTIAAAQSEGTLTVTATSTVDTTKSDTATVTVVSADTVLPEDPTVTSVTVTPATVSHHPEETQQFTAAVVVTGGAAETVTWKVEGKDSTVKHADTAINGEGLLTIAGAQSLGTLTVTATSTADPSKSGTATVTVVSAETEIPDPGKVSITIGFINGTVTVSGIPEGGITLSKSGAASKPTSLALTVEGYTSPVWYVDGAETGTSGNSITLNANGYEVRKHSVSFTGTKDGVLYAQEIPFTVVE